MATQYNLYGGTMDELNSFLYKNNTILDKLIFKNSWNWVGMTYIQCFTIDLYDEDENISDFSKKQNQLFFKRYKLEKEIGYWMSELFHELENLTKINEIPFGSSTMSITDTCFYYSRYTNKNNIDKIVKLFETDFNLRTKLEFVENGYYKIYLHKDQSVLDKLIINEKKPVKIEKKSHREALLLTQKHLQEELKKIEKQLKKTKI